MSKSGDGPSGTKDQESETPYKEEEIPNVSFRAMQAMLGQLMTKVDALTTQVATNTDSNLRVIGFPLVELQCPR